MFSGILRRMQEKIRRCEYVMTPHARTEMDDDELTIYDIERGILTGRIVERQKDRQTAEWKYRIIGETVDGEDVEMVMKISLANKLVIITVYVL